MVKSFKIIIVDDDNSARNILQKFLEIGDDVQIVASVNNTKEAMIAIEKFVPDVIFLDINMPKENGLQFAQRLRKNKIDIQIIFTTAYRNFAANAFELKPLDFLVKPFGMHDIFDVLTKIESYFEEQEKMAKEKKIWGSVIPDKLKFKTGKGYSFIKPKDILFIQVVEKFIELHLYNGDVERVFATLSDLDDELKHMNFLRVNRAAIINLAHIERIESVKRKCIIKGETEEVSFVVTKNIFKYFENMKSIKLG